MQIVSFLRRQFAWNVKAYFLEKITKIHVLSISAELGQRVVKVIVLQPNDGILHF